MYSFTTVMSRHTPHCFAMSCSFHLSVYQAYNQEHPALCAMYVAFLRTHSPLQKSFIEASRGRSGKNIVYRYVGLHITAISRAMVLAGFSLVRSQALSSAEHSGCESAFVVSVPARRMLSRESTDRPEFRKRSGQSHDLRGEQQTHGGGDDGGETHGQLGSGGG